jgi:hypothetical protein
MIVLAFLSDPEVVPKILSHLGIPTCVPGVPSKGALAPARSSAPPTGARRALAFALPEDEVVSGREEGDDAGDAGVPEPAIGPPP